MGVCVGPIYVSEIAPFKIRGSVGTQTPVEELTTQKTLIYSCSGVLTQLSIVVGIMITQVLGLYLSTPRHWRFVLLISSALSTIQFFLGLFIVESPSYLARKGLLEEQKTNSRRLWGLSESGGNEQLGQNLFTNQLTHLLQHRVVVVKATR